MALKPKFVTIGFQKCGTKSYREFLRSYNNIYIPQWEETLGLIPHGEHLPITEEDVGNRRFGVVNPGFSLFDVEENAKKLYEFAPSATIVTIERDPVARAYSAWRMFASVESYGETRDFYTAIQDCLENPDAEPTWINQYVKAGEYERIKRIYRDVGFWVASYKLEQISRHESFPHLNEGVVDTVLEAEKLLKEYYEQ